MQNLNPKHFPAWVLGTLVNDEYASDEELVDFSRQESGVSEVQARVWVAERAY